ncbi:MAG TPA: carboxyl transferase domain-containing protein [Desulfomonilaceae bacterium]|nr:carboxyl transferase domain-containing protein [Desulfomonilaceae bacterium]
MGMKEALEELERRKAMALEMGGPEQVARKQAMGLETARERVAKLLDPGSFFEIGMLNHSDLPGMEDKTPADGKIAGFGTIDGRTVAVTADDATVLAGTGGRVGVEKAHRLHRWAIEKGYPIIHLGEGGGARIPDIMGSEGLSSMTMRKEMAIRSREVPFVATIMGECFGGPSWLAALADFVVQVKGSCMAVSGPRVLEVATSEQVENEDLGGWKLHAEITGQVDRVAEDEEDCFRIVREFLSYMPSNAQELPPVVPPRGSDQEARQQELLSLVPEESRRGYDMNRVIKTIVDDEQIFVLKPDFDRSVITCLARIEGHSVGIIANQPMHTAGAMGPDGCDKCCSFICLCDSFNIPLIFLHDTPGFLVGRAAELKRMPGKIINFIEAAALSTVPKVSLVIRKSYGMAYSNMCGTGMGADFVLAWPNAEISFMAPEVAANVVYRRKIDESDDIEAARHQAEQQIRAAGAPWKAAGLHLLDDVIDPRDTRKVLSRIIDLARGSDGGYLSRRLLANWPTTF